MIEVVQQVKLSYSMACACNYRVTYRRRPVGPKNSRRTKFLFVPDEARRPKPNFALRNLGAPLPSVSCSTMPKGIPAPGPWDLPGDVSTLSNEGLAEGESIWVRLATIVRARRLDLRLLMNACDLHNRGM